MPAHRIAWSAFILVLLFAAFFIFHTVPQLPPMVASHFDAAGYPNAFMTRAAYQRFMFTCAAGLPVAMVLLLTLLYSRARDFKLPNRDYWLAPQRIAQTRAFLIAHGIWFGSMMVLMVCFVHWLELTANRQATPHLPGALAAGGLLLFFLMALTWIMALIVSFRRPRGP